MREGQLKGSGLLSRGFTRGRYPQAWVERSQGHNRERENFTIASMILR